MLKKVGGRKFVEYKAHLYLLVLNDMWVEWVGERWDLFTIYSNNELGLLFTDGLKWKNGTPIRGQREY